MHFIIKRSVHERVHNCTRLQILGLHSNYFDANIELLLKIR
jgi:hypothetical protein